MTIWTGIHNTTGYCWVILHSKMHQIMAMLFMGHGIYHPQQSMEWVLLLWKVPWPFYRPLHSFTMIILLKRYSNKLLRQQRSHHWVGATMGTHLCWIANWLQITWCHVSFEGVYNRFEVCTIVPVYLYCSMLISLLLVWTRTRPIFALFSPLLTRRAKTRSLKSNICDSEHLISTSQGAGPRVVPHQNTRQRTPRRDPSSVTVPKVGPRS